MLSMGGSSYAYDGAGNRIQQTVSATVTNYLLDLQPGLAPQLSKETYEFLDNLLKIILAGTGGALLGGAGNYVEGIDAQHH